MKLFTFILSLLIIFSITGNALSKNKIKQISAESSLVNTKISIDIDKASIKDVLNFLEEISQIYFEPIWQNNSNLAGIDPEHLISLNSIQMPLYQVLDNISEQLSNETDKVTWQFNDRYDIQIGTKDSLNKYKILIVYDINDLLFQIPNFDNAPTLDLDQVLNQGQQGGSGSSGSIFQDNDQNDLEITTRNDLAQEIIDILIETIEPDQWRDNGGDGGNIIFFRGTFLINAPNYIHKQLQQ